MRDVLRSPCILLHLSAASRRGVLRTMCARAASVFSLQERELFSRASEEESLVSTGAGNGAAILHVCASGVSVVSGVFASLRQGISFDPAGRQETDLIFLLLTPKTKDNRHLLALAWLSRFLGSAENLEKLRSSTTADAVLSLFGARIPDRSA